MNECGYCGVELPERERRAGRAREYCTDSHRVMASRLRKAETEYARERDGSNPAT